MYEKEKLYTIYEYFVCGRWKPEREKCFSKLQHDRNRDTNGVIWGQSLLRKTQQLLVGRTMFSTVPWGPFWGGKRMLNSASWTEFPVTDTGLQRREKMASMGPRGHIIHWDSALWLGMMVALMCSSRVIYQAFVKFSGKEVDSHSDTVSGSDGKIWVLDKDRRHSRFWGKFLLPWIFQTAIPSSPSLHSYLSFNCAKQLCMVFVNTSVQKLLLQLWWPR